MANAQLYGPLDVSIPAFGARTRLYNLPPIGIGTEMAESLTGYIIRLAEAHVVSPGALMTKEVWKVLAPSDPEEHTPIGRQSTFIYDAHTLNGATSNAERWVAALEAATGRTDLAHLTLLPWKQLFSSQGLVRRERTWCPRCYQEWQDTGQSIYEPLHWAMAAVSMCFRHRSRLAEICPHCGTRPYLIAATSLPGHCSRCGQWLGLLQHATPQSEDSGGMNNDGLSVNSTAALLAITHGFRELLSGSVFRANLRHCVNDLAAGNKKLFRVTAGVDSSTIKRWLDGLSLPSLASALNVSSRLGIPLVQLMTQVLPPGEPHWDSAQQAIQRSKAAQSGNRRIHRVHVALPAQSMGSPASRSQQEKVLRNAVRQNPPPSFREVEKALAQHPNTLKKRFPALYQSLVSRGKECRRLYREEVRQTLEAALTEEPPPTLKELAARLGHRTTSAFRQWFPNLYRALSARSARRHEWQLNAQRSLLESALIEEPAPAGDTAAARMGTDSSYLRALFPQLWRQIVARHAEQRQRNACSVRTAFRQEVRRIALELIEAGKYPSRRRVCSLIRGSTLYGGHLVVDEVRALMADLQGPHSEPAPAAASEHSKA